MERLTYRPESPFISRTSGKLIKVFSDEEIREVIHRLADYEDTGLTPEEVNKVRMDTEAGYMKSIARAYGIDVERLKELARADREGRVAVLPCKVGDTVYYRCGKRITDFEVVGFSVDKQGASIIYAEHHADENNTAYSCFFDITKIGRTVFFTREEALRRAENGKR